MEVFVQFPLLNLNRLTKESAALHSDLSGGPVKKIQISLLIIDLDYLY
jgi:hypothetical protein